MNDFQKIKILYSQPIILKKKKYILNDDIKRGILSNINDSSFCPENVKLYFMKCDNYLYIANEKYNISLNVFYYKKLYISHKKLINAIKNIIILKQLFDIRKQLNIQFIASSYKRYFPKKNEIVECKHINGGFTSSNDSYIFILRIEEFTKVLIHEFLHHVKVIDNQDWPKDHIKKLMVKFNIDNSTQLIPNEAIVELWATIYNCMFIAIKKGVEFKKIYKVELNHSITMYNKILQLQGVRKWKEKTNSFAYIVFKTILLYNINKLKLYPYTTKYLTNFLIRYKNSIPRIHREIKNNSMRMLLLSN